jgi:hypothetical protein
MFGVVVGGVMEQIGNGQVRDEQFFGNFGVIKL